MVRPYHVYDYTGEHLGSFAAWDVAHEWAHLQAALAGVVTPLAVEDRLAGTCRHVWAERCGPMTTYHPGDRHTADGPPAPDHPAGGATYPTQATPLDSGMLCAVASGPVFSPPRPRVPS
jgi:hypothetical protein